MNKQEYLDCIKNAFVDCFRHDNNRDDYDNIHDFMDYVKSLGLSFSNCYHANGIGNNNEYTIYLDSYDDEGFNVQKNVCVFYYCNGIYGGRYHSLQDMNNNVICRLGDAR